MKRLKTDPDRGAVIGGVSKRKVSGLLAYE